MAKSTRTPPPTGSGRGGAAASGGGRRGRATPVKVGKPFPWGTVVVSVVLGALLIGILAYAVMNQGGGVRNVLKEDDKSFSSLKTYSNLSRNHVAAAVTYPGYPGLPAAGGDHHAVPQSCAVYPAAIAPEHAVHSLEHGAVWVTYRPDLPAGQVSALKTLVDGNPYRLMSPLPGQKAAIELTAWGRQIAASAASDPQVVKFLSTYTNGPQTPEKGSACEGTTATGDAPLNSTGATPAPSAPAATPTP
jgi:hypothetical protein